MRKAYLLINLLSLLFIPIGSCEELDRHDNNGYDSDVRFPREGKTIVLKGKKSFDHIYLRTIEDICDGGKFLDYDVDVINDTLIVHTEWLTLKTEKNSHSLTLIAEPNNTGYERSLKVVGYFPTDSHCDEHATIYVKQK